MVTGLKVSEVAALAGVSADTVRYYERVGLVPAPPRAPNGYRIYDGGVVERLEFIRRAQRFGLRLSGIAELLDIRDQGLCPCGHSRQLVEKRLAEVEAEQQTLSDLAADIRTMLADTTDTSACDDGAAVPVVGCDRIHSLETTT